MNIIMHHAKNQIGLEAVEGRIQKYPDLDLSSLENWISRQEKEDSGTGVIDTYVWDDPGLKKSDVSSHFRRSRSRENDGSLIPHFRSRNFRGHWKA